jgi:hypothetical protein
MKPLHLSEIAWQVLDGFELPAACIFPEMLRSLQA